MSLKLMQEEPKLYVKKIYLTTYGLKYLANFQRRTIFLSIEVPWYLSLICSGTHDKCQNWPGLNDEAFSLVGWQRDSFQFQQV